MAFLALPSLPATLRRADGAPDVRSVPTCSKCCAHVQGVDERQRRRPERQLASQAFCGRSSARLVPSRPPRGCPRAQESAAPPACSSSAAREVLSERAREKLDPSDDGFFYLTPRFVTHVDDGFIARLTELYRERLRPGSTVLDLCSSWVSHLPDEVQFERVVGHGLNLAELGRNKRLDDFFVQNLNKDQRLPLEDASFDAVLCCVSVQYLQFPERVFADVLRVLRPGGVLIVSFSDRMFYTKAIEAWRESGMRGRANLVKSYVRAVPGFSDPETVHSDGTPVAPPLHMQIFEQIGILRGVAGGLGDPFRAVVAYKL